MKYHLLILSLFIIFVFQGCDDSEIVNPDSREDFFEVELEANVIYGSATTQGGVTEDLVMDIYSPRNNNSTERPLLILAHGGGFLGGDKISMSDLATYFASSGYVVASLKYRLVDVEETPDVMRRGVIDAMHDMRASIRFFRKDLSSSNVYRIDDENIFAGGYSAGAFMGLHAAYVGTEIEIQEIGGQNLLSYVNANGGLEGNSGNPGYSSRFRGVISLSGALSHANLIDSGEPILFSFHGTADSIVPYLNGESDGSGVATDGPGIYHPVAEAAAITNLLITIQNGEHDVFWTSKGAYKNLHDFINANLAE